MPEYKSTVYLLSNATAVISTKDVVGDAALLTETISADIYQNSNAIVNSTIREIVPISDSYQKVISYQSSSCTVRTIGLLDDLVFLDSNATVNSTIREIVTADSYQKVISYQSSSYIFRKVVLLDDLVFLDSNAVLNSTIREIVPAPSYQKVISYPVYEYSFRTVVLLDDLVFLDSNAVLNSTIRRAIPSPSYQKVISYPVYEHIFRKVALLDDLVFLDSNAVLNSTIREIVTADSYQKVISYQSSSYIFRKVVLLDDLVFLDSNAVLNSTIREIVPAPSYQKVISYPVYEYSFRTVVLLDDLVFLDSNAVLNSTIRRAIPSPSYQKVISYPVYKHNFKSAPYTPIIIDSNASFNPGLVAIAELFVISNGVATCTIVKGLHANLLVKSYSFFVISDTAPPPGEQSFTARQRSGASFSAQNPTYFSFSADQSSSSEMVYARYDEAFSFSCGQPTSASFAFVYTDYNTNLPSMYCGNPSFEVTNVLGGWKKVIGMDTLLKIEHGVSAKAMVKAHSSCPEEAISIRFKIASEKSSPTGYFVLDDDGTWSPDNMSVTVFVDDPGWYKLEWYVKVGRGARMDWIKLSGATISHS